VTAAEPEVDAETLAQVERRWGAVRRRMERVGGADVRVVAVTKGHGPWAVAAARALGLLDVGENYAQELIEKAGLFGPQAGLRWHAIGRLQRNKVRKLAPMVSLWQSVDRLALGYEIARCAPGAPVLVQVNVSGEPQKGGCAPAELTTLVHGLLTEGLDVRGLMAIGPTGPPELSAGPFREAVAMADDLGLPERSLGMSADLEVAIEAGATMVRVGSDLFGPRRRTADPQDP
jgi:pyridoxal phosphate enzyme (YggS family)